MSEKDRLLKAAKEREVIKKTLAYWEKHLKNDDKLNEEEVIIFVTMNVIGQLNEQLEGQTYNQKCEG